MADGNSELAVLGGGCFWCLEAVYQQIKGVRAVVSGYAGGEKPNPTYKEVCAEVTGHAEVVQIEFEPSVVDFADLLDVFFTIHDPTTLNRQGNDVGTQYRSIILYTTDMQKMTAEYKISEVTNSGLYGGPVVTTVEPLAEFYPAEEYHQNYYKYNSQAMYCRLVVEPKIAKARAKFLGNLIES